LFNVCPGCGEYSDAKKVIGPPIKAVCTSCGYESKFLSLPLFVITGANGSGKTTAALELIPVTQDFVILDQDILWNDAFNEPENDFRLFRNTWLRMVKNIHQAGKPVVLFGSAIPEQYESCVERRYVGSIHYLALVCQPSELRRRLVSRPNWRKSGSPTNVEKMLDFNNWLFENASKTEPKMDVLDTTGITVQETVQSILDWLGKGIAVEIVNFPTFHAGDGIKRRYCGIN
jgi:broad-specificity NMP kinase